jgi:hypothetical protein
MILIMFFKFFHSFVKSINSSHTHLNIKFELFIVSSGCKLILFKLDRFILKILNQRKESFKIIVSASIINSHSKGELNLLVNEACSRFDVFVDSIDNLVLFFHLV